jgi:hypothetical protein
MKTSLNLDDALYDQARRAALESGRSLSETISEWARLGARVYFERQVRARGTFQPLSLGDLTLDLTRRRDWMETLDEQDT